MLFQLRCKPLISVGFRDVRGGNKGALEVLVYQCDEGITRLETNPPFWKGYYCHARISQWRAHVILRIVWLSY